jgi:RNA polymerase sigma factor (sigma-70 family)
MAYYTETDDITFTPLTAEQEQTLFTRFNNSTGEAALEARDIIIHHFLKLAAKLGLQFAKGNLTEEDAISAANFGLIKAIESKKFTSKNGARFCSYVRLYIHEQIMAAIRSRGPKRLPPSFHQNAPDATITGVEAVHEKYMDKHLGRLFTETTEMSVDHEYEGLQLDEARRTLILQALDKLPELEAYAIRRVGLEGQNFAVVGEEKNVSREAARKAFGRGIKKVRALLEPVRSELL